MAGMAGALRLGTGEPKSYMRQMRQRSRHLRLVRARAEASAK